VDLELAETPLPPPSEVISTSSPEFTAALSCMNTFYKKEKKQSDVGHIRNEVWPYMMRSLPKPFAQRANDLGFVMALLTALQDENKVMLVDGVCHLIG
jgi:hypothetical protein